MPQAFLDLKTGAVSDSSAGNVPVIYLEDSWTSVLCDIRDWMINHASKPIPAPFITVKNNPNSGQVIEILVVADQEDVEWWSDKLTEVAPQNGCNYFVMNRIGNSLTIGYDQNATAAPGTTVQLAGPGDAVGRSACYGNIKGGKRSDEGEFEDSQRGGGGGGGGPPGPGRGGGGGGPPSPHSPTLEGSGESASPGEGQGQGGESGEGEGEGQGQGQGEGSESGGECSTCDGSGMGSGPGADEGGEGQGDGSGSGDSGESGESGEGSDGGDGQGEGSGSGEGESDMCGDCNGTGQETPVDDLPDNIGEEGMSPTQEAADKQAAEDFGKQQEECSEQCAECADQAEESRDEGDVEGAVESAKAAQEVGNPRSKKDNDNMARAKEAAHDAIDEAFEKGDITQDQANALHDDVDSPTPSNQSESQRLADEARQEANDAFDAQDADKMQAAADKAQQAADEVQSRNDAGSVQTAAKDIADLAQNMGEGDIEDDMRDLANEMKQRSQEKQWGIKDTESGEFLNDDQGVPAEFGSEQDAEDMLDELGNPDGMEVAPLPNRLDEAMNKAKEDYPDLDIDDPQTRDEFQEQYDRTMDDLSAGEICTVTNLDGDFAPTAGDTYKNLLNYAMLLNPMIGGMMQQAKKVPVMLSVMSEKKPLGLLVIKDDEMDRLEELQQDSKYSEHSIDKPKQPEDEPKWAAFTYPLPPTLDDSFGINSQVRILEDQGYWVKVRPLTNAKGYMSLLKANLDCFDEQAVPSDLQDVIDTPNMPTSAEELQRMLDEARRRRARKKRQEKTVSGDAMLEYRVDIITGERRTFDKNQLLAGEAGRTFVQIHRTMGVMSDLTGLIELLESKGIGYTVLQQKVGPTQIETTPEGVGIATGMGKPLVVRGNKVGYL